MKFVLSVGMILLCLTSLGFADSDREIHAVKISQPIKVDGKLNESVWSSMRPISEFVQRDPNQGEAPTEKTEVWIGYDDNALYIAARLYDSHPDSIMKVLSRRDNISTSDWFIVFIDPYHDKRSGNYFAIGPSGMLGDGVLFNDDWDNSDWDGVWEGKANIDETGWTVEMRIPFSQLKFHEQQEQIWGIDFRRDIGRKNEQDYITYTPRMQSGFVSRFHELVGIEGVKPSNQAEFLPFTTTKAEYTHPSVGNPFNSGSRYHPDFGADLRYGLNGNLVLNATVNPDFGQVEVDPAVVNLTDVESFFQEKRPFFVEGANIFTMFGQGGGNNYWNFNYPQPTFFYSRRIGRSPHGNDTLDNVDYVDMPIATRILGAAKITGKLSDSWNVGTVHAVTSRMIAPFQINGTRSEAEIEPSAYYGIARVQKEFPDGRQGIGFMGTLARRSFSLNDIGSRLENFINRSAVFAGIDGWTFLDEDKMWVITGYSAMSHVNGSKERITNLQTNSVHYFQRPDASYLKVDSNATSLTGFTGRAYLIKQKGNSYVNASFGIIDPKFEINDLGFLSRTNVINMHGGGGYVWSEPEGIFRTREIGGGVGQSYDFGGNLIHRVVVEWLFAKFTNYYSINLNFAQNPSTAYNIRRTRGGPITLNPKGWEADLMFNTDDRKEVFVNGYANTYFSSITNFVNYGAAIQFRPSSSVTFSIGPDLTLDQEKLQWVDRYNDAVATSTFGSRYVFGEMNQKTISANIRLNWTFSPKISLQLFAQPLISSGAFTNLKMLARSRSDEYVAFRQNGTTINKVVDPSSHDVRYTVDGDGVGPATSHTLNNPDFNFKSLRGNAVLRWEYLPGSTIYFVWTQSRSDNEGDGEFRFNHSLYRLGNSRPDNIFLIKMSYYFNV